MFLITPRALTEAQGLAVFRAVQEGLTNVLKHAGRTRATVRLEWEPRLLRVCVDNAPGEGLVGPGAGRGLSGLAERAAILGGTARWGVSAVFPGGFAVTMEVPA